jgi:hypothetical protein
MYVVEGVSKKGEGFIATKDIPKGTRIISEDPVITVERLVANIE